MKYTVLTLFPELITPWTQEALIGKAVQRGLLEFELRDIREFAETKHRKVDDTPYGGGAGMVMRADVIERALENVQSDAKILLSPSGKPLTQKLAEEFSGLSHIALVCGRYEGIDARSERLFSHEISVGDFVLMGGEAAALCFIEATSRLIPGVIGDAASHQADSFSSGLLDYPEYTRPPEWRGENVPEVLLGGNHAAIARWRRKEALGRTLKRRPDLLKTADLTDLDAMLLLELGVSEAAVLQLGLNLPKPKRKR